MYGSNDASFDGDAEHVQAETNVRFCPISKSSHGISASTRRDAGRHAWSACRRRSDGRIDWFENYNRNEFGKRFVDGNGPQTSAHRGREAHTWSRPIGDHRSGENRSEFVHDRRMEESSPTDDNRAAHHVQIPRDLQRSSRMHVRWVATAQMIADALAKEVESFALDHVLQTPQININQHRALHGFLLKTDGRKLKHAPSTLPTTGGLSKRPTQRSCHRARSVISLIAPA